MDLVFAPSQIETWPLDRLRPYARNAKIHGIDQVGTRLGKGCPPHGMVPPRP